MEQSASWEANRFSASQEIPPPDRDFDMDMSYARMLRTASLTSYPVRCKILHQRTPSLS
jgi:hypothetical protein